MKIEDTAKQLANKINQEHYILHYLKKIEKDAFDRGYIAGMEKARKLKGVKEN
jgi:hypothetical protein